MDLMICGTEIRKDEEGRYCLNDLHRASGGLSHHQPGKFFANKNTQDLVNVLRGASPNLERPVRTVNDGRRNGTFVAKELVYAYAMWISPAFHLKVIRAYDALVAAPVKPPAKLSRMDLLQIAMDAERERLVLADRVAVLEPQAAVAERISTARGSFCIRDAAKSLQVRPIDLTNRMLAAQWIYKRPGRRGYVPYGAKLQQLLLEVKQVPIGEDDDGHERLEEQVRITAKGLTRLAAELGRPMVQ